MRETTYTPYPGAPFSPSFLTEHLALLAEDRREAVGCVYANTSVSDDFGFVFGLYVRPDMRRRGCARLLMRSVAEQLQDALYEDLGFTDAARTLRVEVKRLL